jgi:hypothetical protein
VTVGAPPPCPWAGAMAPLAPHEPASARAWSPGRSRHSPSSTAAKGVMAGRRAAEAFGSLPVWPPNRAASLSGTLSGRWARAVLFPACCCWRQLAFCLVSGHYCGAEIAQLDMVRRRSTVRFRNGARGSLGRRSQVRRWSMSSIVSWREGYGLACGSGLSRRRTRLLLGWGYHWLGAPDELETAP